jgi:hypothetical protein
MLLSPQPRAVAKWLIRATCRLFPNLEQVSQLSSDQGGKKASIDDRKIEQCEVRTLISGDKVAERDVIAA